MNRVYRDTDLRKLLLGTLLAIAVVAPCRAQTSADLGPPVTLSAGDVVKISVWRRPELSGDFVVGGDGTIVHPLYRVLHVAGIPLPMVEARVQEFLKQFEESPAFSVAPLLRVYVGGQVRSPNVLTVPPGTTLAQALAAAGGPTDDANLKDVRLIRGTDQRSIDLTASDLSVGQVTVRSGDQIAVTRADSFVRDRLAPTAAVISALASLASIVVVLTRK